MFRSELHRIFCQRFPASFPLVVGALTIAAFTVACSSTDVSTTAPSSNKCQVSVDTASPSMPAAGGTGALTVTTTRDYT